MVLWTEYKYSQDQAQVSQHKIVPGTTFTQSKRVRNEMRPFIKKEQIFIFGDPKASKSSNQNILPPMPQKT